MPPGRTARNPGLPESRAALHWMMLPGRDLDIVPPVGRTFLNLEFAGKPGFHVLQPSFARALLHLPGMPFFILFSLCQEIPFVPRDSAQAAPESELLPSSVLPQHILLCPTPHCSPKASSELGTMWPVVIQSSLPPGRQLLIFPFYSHRSTPFCCFAPPLHYISVSTMEHSVGHTPGAEQSGW